MKRLHASMLAIGLSAVAATASAQSYPSSGQPYPDRYGASSGAIYDYARVVRVDPVFDGYRQPVSTAAQRCRPGPQGGYVGNDPYRRDGYYGNDTYRRDGYYGNDPYYPQAGRAGSETGRTLATVLGGVAGAVLGSKVGGGSGTYAATAIGSMVGGMAGRQIYETTQRNRLGEGQVTICDPEPVRDNYNGYTRYPASDTRVNAYDVTYEYAGRRFTTRTNYHPGDRIRVRVDVRPE